MDASLKPLLEELYAADPTLRRHEADVIALIEQMRVSQPKGQPDADFIKRLRVSVLERIATPAPRPIWTKLVMWAAPVAAVALVAFLVRPSPKSNNQIQSGHGVTIATVGDAAFGTLGLTATKSTTASGREAAVAPTANGAGVATDTQSSSMIAQPSFVATVFTPPSTYSLPSLPVLRRDAALDGMTGLLSTMSLSQIQLSSFTNVQLDYVTLSEQKEHGYTITIDRKNGQISLYKNYSGDVIAVKEMATNSPSNSTPMPADGAIITTANQFLGDHGISRQGLAEPIVRKDWQMYKLMIDSASSSAYSPSDVTVVYPWVLGGVPVVDDGGQPYGLMVVVHLADMTVTSVSNIVPLSFTSSNYDLVTATSQLADVIKRGGVYGYVPDTAATTNSVQLGAPTAVYTVSRYQLNSDDADVLVPALSFPVPDDKVSVAGRSFVIVPVVKQLLELNQKSYPYAMPATSSGSATTPTDLVVPETAPVNK